MTQLVLIPLDIFEPIDPLDQATRVPGIDAPCHCQQPECAWPFCSPPTKGDQHDHNAA